MNGQKVAIFGLGRSGLAIGKAARALGGSAHVFDEKSLDALSKKDIVAEAKAAHLPVTLGWKGEFKDKSWDLVVVNPAVPRTHPKLRAALDSGLRVVSEVEFAYLISKAPIVAITGTNGKSTTTVMTMLCLRACGEDAVLCGNVYGSGYPEVPLTDAALSASKDQILVAEISSFQLEWISQFRPAVAGITNITPDHLDRYASFAEYAAIKQKIFSNQTHGDFAVVRANDPVVQSPDGLDALSRPKGSRQLSPHALGAVTQGIHGTGDFLHDGLPDAPTVLTFGATGHDARVEETQLSILHRHIPLSDLPFHEPHNLANACMAALLSYAALCWKATKDPDSNAATLLIRTEEEYLEGLDAKRTVYDARKPEPGSVRVLPQAIIDGLEQFRGLAHRMEPVGEKDGVRVINNSMCTNPAAVISSAQSLPARGRLLIGGVNKGLDFQPLAEYLATGRSDAYLFGSDARLLDNMLGGGYPVFATLEQAFAAAAADAQAGEIIMLAPGCASTDQFRDFRDRGEKFKQIAKEWLES